MLLLHCYISKRNMFIKSDKKFQSIKLFRHKITERIASIFIKGIEWVGGSANIKCLLSWLYELFWAHIELTFFSSSMNKIFLLFGTQQILLIECRM